ncbi:MAG TPA: hypothetical protein VMF62_08095 [Acetobacteraceae bacterium]|jgi:hypothetical protein|nr:hypothetical protein [Acetobacteraceae bacterium]
MTTRRILLCCSAIAGLALAAPSFAPPAQAQTMTQPGGPPYGANPYSTKASNLPGSPITSPIAPALPSPDLGPNATVGQYLTVARSALTAGQTGRAQAALEDAETLALTRSVPYNAGGQPATSPLVSNISAALQALGSNDLISAAHYTDLAMQQAGA